MNFNKNYITVSEAISKAQYMVTLPSVIVFLFLMASTIISGVIYDLHPFWGISGMLSSFLFMIALWKYMIVKWKLWAFEKVDDINELIIQSRNSFLIYKDILTTKWSVATKKDKEKLHFIYNLRISENQKFVELRDDNSLFSEFRIKGSKMNNFIGFIIFVGASFYLFTKSKQFTILPIKSDFIIAALCICLAIYFFFKTLNPTTKIVISARGIWTKKTGLQEWSNIEEIKVNFKPDTNMHPESFLAIHFNRQSGLVEKNCKYEFKVSRLDKKSEDIEYAIKIFKKRYEQFFLQINQQP